MHWYNPTSRSMENRTTAPATDEAARAILLGREGAVEEYEGWRVAKKKILAAMIYTGQTFLEIDAGREPPR